MTHNLPAAMLALAPLVAVMAAPDFGPRFAPTHKDNMNGAYPFSATPGGTPGKMPKRFSDYPHGVESFDVHTSEMSTLYSQVWWKPHPPAALPKEIVAKYNGSRMAIVGWEIDQVQRTADGDVSVPISASYNHHYVSQLVGAGARLRQVKLDGPHDPRAKELMHASHGHVNWEQPQWIAEDVVEAAGGEGREAAAQSTRQWFSSGNGGEYRKTYHGFAPGYAMVVDSPTHLQMAPMQIDTWNREAMDISARRQGPVRFVPGPQPRASLAPADAAHSGLLECPMTTRLTKVVDGAYAVHANASSCAEPILTYHECFEAARKVFTHVVSVSNASGADARRPVGCSAALRPSSASVSVFFNEMASPPTACSVAHQCVCPVAPKPFGQATGALRYHPTSQPADVGRGFAARFGGGGKSCAAWPSTDLIEHRNPTCDIRHYQGGQWACNHGWSLLDAEQQIPWADRPLVFVHKFRFYVQPYVPCLPHAHPAGRDGGLGAAARLPMGVRRAAVRRGRARLLARRAWHVGAQGGGQARGQAHLCGAQQPLPRAHLPRDGGVRLRQGHPPRGVRHDRGQARLPHGARLRRHRLADGAGQQVRRGGVHRHPRLLLGRRRVGPRAAAAAGRRAAAHCQDVQRHPRPLRRDGGRAAVGV